VNVKKTQRAYIGQTTSYYLGMSVISKILHQLTQVTSQGQLFYANRMSCEKWI